MASFPQVSKTLDSKGVSDIMNQLGRQPQGRLRPIKSDQENRK